MNAIVFSKDRAIQLHALLDSLFANCDLFDEVHVLYKTKYYESYEILKEEMPRVKWHEQQIFKLDFLKLIQPGLNCLLVDDDIIYRPVSEAMIHQAMTECDVFSLRLGNNITKKSHFSVKSSVDGNIFYSHDLKKMEQERFRDPNWLEIELNKHVKDLTMCWGEQSHLIGIPNNKVSNTSWCSHMNGDLNELDNYFLQGYRIDWRAMNLEHWTVHKREIYTLTL